MGIVISKIGIACPLGDSVEEFSRRVDEQSSVLREIPILSLLENSQGAMVEKYSLRGILKKRKEAKLFTRAAALGLIAANRCVGKINDDDMGLFVAVGREPPDEGAAEECLIRSQENGIFSEKRLATEGKSLYPPLLPLRTLPNMILAHISIQLGIMGENGCWAGGQEAAVQAFSEGFWAIKEGRCTKALVGAADGFINLGAARDLHRSQKVPPSEGGVFFLLEEQAFPEKGTFILKSALDAPHQERDIRSLMGYCGAAQSLFGLLAMLHDHEFLSWGRISFQKALQ